MQLARAGVVALLFLLLVGATSPAMTADTPPPDPLAEAAVAPGLGGFLDEAGRLDLPAGFSGSLDPAGYRLASEHGEAPRFVSDAAKGGSGDAWTGFGGISDGCNGQVRAIAIGDGGEVYLGGDFTLCGGTSANHVARFDTSTQAWSSLGVGLANGVNDTVRALAVSGSTVYVGGLFNQAGGAPARNVARFDTGTQTWAPLGSGGAQGVDGSVDALAVSGSSVYAGGVFSQAGGVTANKVARFDTNTQTWAPLGAGAGDGLTETVRALAVSGSLVYVGGNFTQAGGATANRVARFDTITQTWASLGTGGANGVNGSVDALAVSGSSVYAGGVFTQAGGVTANRVARFDTTTQTWASLGSGGANGVNGSVNALVVSGSAVYVAGFSLIQAGGAPANGVARFDTTTQTWASLGSGGANGVNSLVNALAVSGSAVYVGGGFTQAGGAPAGKVARFDTSTQTWTPLGAGVGNGVNETVLALAVSGSSVYVGGEFTHAGGATASRVARFDTSTQSWSPLGSGAANGVNSTVRALAVSGSSVYVGGDFTLAGGATANRVARFDTSTQTWAPLGSGPANGVTGQSISALAVSSNTVYVGGFFTQAGGATANNVAQFDTSTQTWGSLGTGIANGVNSRVNALAVSGSTVYVGGNFTQAGGATANRVARFNTSPQSWAPLGSGAANGVNNIVNALAVSGSTVYVGGFFTQAGGATANQVARFDTSTQTWAPLGSGAANGMNSFVNALTVSGRAVYVGGDFTQSGGATANRVARFDMSTQSWASLSNGVLNGVGGRSISALATAADGTLYVGGDFGSAEGQVSSSIARYSPPKRLSVDTLTPDSTEPSLEATASGNGRFVVFESLDPALHTPCPSVPNPPRLCGAGGASCPATGPLYLFRVDTTQGCVDLINLDTTGALIKMVPHQLGKGDGEEPLGKPSPSADGNLVAFVGDDAAVGKLWGESKSAREQRQKTGGLGIFLRNIQTGTTRRVGTSTNTGIDPVSGQPINGGRPQVAPDGRSVVYTGILGGKPTVMQARINDLGGFDSLCVACRSAGGTDPASFTLPLDGFAHNATVSADGNVVAYQTVAKDAAPSNCSNGANNTAIILRNIQTGTVRTVSQPRNTSCQLGSSGKPRIDFSGTQIVFESTQPLTAGAPSRREVYRFDARTDRLEQVSLSSSGTQVDAASGEPTISGDGLQIAFTSRARQGFGGDLPADAPVVSHVVVRDLRSATVRRLSENLTGAQANGDSFRPSLSYTGDLIAFDSVASNLSTADSNGTISDVFLRVNPQTVEVVFGSGFE